ncbi:FAD-binding protein [Lutimonas saemankumensis]|uniref:FAD-binding and (Fe-S)-binding domain-containing protein n=1 Tax=Lutimonas saemankumensis TaxID=483016 RepID=UPI001CD3B2E7|nr:FAD-binding and (Fe-S)-binding domain-containing protein [Lutimonas saemankumensis]MCA0931553.1 FAD-binding protein [Lutimonas saemankumensis]
MSVKQALQELNQSLEGEVQYDELHKRIYATDASVYRKLPLAVAFPKNGSDLKKLLEFASKNRISLTPRTAGTSLAGQCVGDGIIVDTSKYFTKILAFDEKNKTIRVQPGVIRDELNEFLKPFGLFFGPNTSTSNRCMIGGMVGNNSSGTTSIQYGVTRDKVLEMNTILSDGSDCNFGPLSKKSFLEKLKGNSLESKVYNLLYQELSKEDIQQEIKKEFPKPGIHRRNNGYAIDALLENEVFSENSSFFNLSKLMCGSEGTLAFTTDITLSLDTLPPQYNMMVAAHFESIQESLEAVVVAMKHNLYTCELMDKTILDCTKNNREQIKNRFFVEKDPAAILMLEVSSNDPNHTRELAENLVSDLKSNGYGYAYPILEGDQIASANNLRKAGLGLLGNIVGDRKAVACIEDTAVEVHVLPAFIREFTAMMKKYGQEAVYYAHAGAGELHLRPILNLKQKEDVGLFREITTQVAHLVKKYGGSMSGEHGDGIVRSEFLEFMLGKKNYDLMKRIKRTFDPQQLLNPGKIIDPWPMDASLRYEVDRKEPEIQTLQDFSDSMGILRATEKCNGSGDCRKPVFAGGTMCPSYRATKDEKDSTRARANTLREFLTHSKKANRFDHEELKEVFDLCLSCKACASECPSNVDVAALKSEFLYQYQKENGVSFRTKLFADNVKYNKMGSLVPGLANFVLNTRLAKNALGIAKERTVPPLAQKTARKWYHINKNSFLRPEFRNGLVYLFLDEFSNFYDVEIARDCIELLTKLQYKVIITDHKESGRSFISKGLLDEAKEVANFNISYFEGLITEHVPLVGIEPSAILSFRDEYLRLAEDKEKALKLSKYTFTIEEFLEREIMMGRIRKDQFTHQKKELKIHGHCQQKSLSNMKSTQAMLNLPVNYNSSIMNTGCCGMAGSFGYEKEHYDLSMRVGEDTLFPKIRNTAKSVEIVASGTSCRHQIKDGTGRRAKHPVTVLRDALK